MQLLNFPLIFLLITNIISSNNKTYFNDYCNKRNGTIQTGYRCPNSKIYIPLRFCIIKSDSKVVNFFDGCTGPTGGNYELFLDSCVKHDECYHFEPITTGKSQSDCDKDLYINLLNNCNKSNKISSCKRWAKTMYLAVSNFGKLAFSCEKTIKY